MMNNVINKSHPIKKELFGENKGIYSISFCKHLNKWFLKI